MGKQNVVPEKPKKYLTKEECMKEVRTYMRLNNVNLDEQEVFNHYLGEVLEKKGGSLYDFFTKKVVMAKVDDIGKMDLLINTLSMGNEFAITVKDILGQTDLLTKLYLFREHAELEIPNIVIRELYYVDENNKLFDASLCITRKEVS